MYRIATTFLIFMWVTLSAKADGFIPHPQKAILEVRYTRTEVYDTTKRDIAFFTDEMMLRIGENMSLFCCAKRFKNDSLLRVNPDIYWAQMKVEIDKGNSNVFASLDGHKRSYLYKYYDENKLVENDYFDMTPWRYTEAWEKPEWEITDETKKVLGYECFKATSDYRGRKWTAWFAPEIPVGEGPWKLCGLPGLILEAYDASKDYSFEACGLVQTGIGDVGYCINQKSDDYIDVTRTDFLKNWWKYKHSNFIAKINAAYGVGAKSDSSDNKARTINYDKEETDYPHNL